MREHLCELLRAHHLPLPAPEDSHIGVDLGGVHLRWEQHTEFQTYTFRRPLAQVPTAFDTSATDLVPREWLARMPGQWLVGLHLLVLPQAGLPDSLTTQMLDASSLCGSRLMGGEAAVATDFRLHADGLGRLLLTTDERMSQVHLGRTVQRLIEVETYRMLALLGLPAAREVTAALAGAERDLANIASRIRSADRRREPELLHELTQLAAQVESLYASTHARFSASAAYFEMVGHRLDELREERLAGLPTLREFLDRRLAPAQQTCAWAGRRQQQLSERISRTSNLLRTRVEIEQQQNSQDLLDTMNRRQKVQILLQSAVEGLSVAAITYYGAGLVGYIAKGLNERGVLPVSPDEAVAVAIPVIALAIWRAIRRLHRVAHRAAGEPDQE
ncbi:MAG: hypothetical protein GAK30_00579 [Paracidovorax wautersii]|uniref:Membrane-anchored protein n=1 Tax=Paracidovorax wautersii TaxID=1177982 RepID=A0A7V8FRK1_9BURK|nr:MAG: hypothetical protein GAK30_00579 [Paracidovorax wautersii]